MEEKQYEKIEWNNNVIKKKDEMEDEQKNQQIKRQNESQMKKNHGLKATMCYEQHSLQWIDAYQILEVINAKRVE